MKRKSNCSLSPSTLLLAAALLLPAAATAQQECTIAPVKGGECWTTEDVIDGRIDHHAQSAMLRMFAAGGERAEEASQMLCAVKTRELDGIYQPDQAVPATRSQAAGKGWWLIIPTAEPSECYKEPADQPPLIAFKKQIKDDRDIVAAALSDAWNACDVTPSAPRCYVPTISKPEPEPEPQGECAQLFECDPTWDAEKIRSVCESYGVATSGECVPIPGETCGTCAAPPPGPSRGCECYTDNVWPCGDGSECLPLQGVEDAGACGFCKGTGNVACIDAALAEYRNDVDVCDQQEKEALPDCVKKMVKCAASVIGGAASAAFRDCVTSAGCFLGGPSHRRFECGGRAAGKHRRQLEECKRQPR